MRVLEPDDLELIRRFRAGDNDAFRDVVDRYKDRLFTYLCRFVSDDRADEAAQDVFVRLFRLEKHHRLKTDSNGSIESFLRCVALHALIDRARHEQTEQIAGGKALAAARHEVQDPEAELLRHELHAHLFAAVRQLPDADRRIVLLHYFERCTCTELAEILGMPRETVKKRLPSARAKLAATLEAYWK